MPLIIKVWDDRQNRWRERQQVLPGDPYASLTNYTVIGGREMYLLRCEPDDSLSTIFRSMAGLDIDLLNARRLVQPEPGQLWKVVQLPNGGKPYEMTLITDRMLVAHRFRFNHITVNFGMRHCLICGQDMPAQRFGRHTLKDHTMQELGDWPGGLAEFLAYLRRSLNESLKCAQGFPRMQAPLRRSLKYINSYEKRLKANRN